MLDETFQDMENLSEMSLSYPLFGYCFIHECKEKLRQDYRMNPNLSRYVHPLHPILFVHVQACFLS